MGETGKLLFFLANSAVATADSEFKIRKLSLRYDEANMVQQEPDIALGGPGGVHVVWSGWKGSIGKIYLTETNKDGEFSTAAEPLNKYTNSSGQPAFYNSYDNSTIQQSMWTRAGDVNVVFS